MIAVKADAIDETFIAGAHVVWTLEPLRSGAVLTVTDGRGPNHLKLLLNDMDLDRLREDIPRLRRRRRRWFGSGRVT